MLCAKIHNGVQRKTGLENRTQLTPSTKGIARETTLWSAKHTHTYIYTHVLCLPRPDHHRSGEKIRTNTPYRRFISYLCTVWNDIFSLPHTDHSERFRAKFSRFDGILSYVLYDARKHHVSFGGSFFFWFSSYDKLFLCLIAITRGGPESNENFNFINSVL